MSRNKPPSKTSAWETEDPVSKTDFTSSLDLKKHFTHAEEGHRGNATTREGLPTARGFLLFLNWSLTFPSGLIFLSVTPLWRFFLTSCHLTVQVASTGNEGKYS